MNRYYMRKIGAPGRITWWSITGIGLIGVGGYGLYTLLLEGDILGASLTFAIIVIGIIMTLKARSDLEMDSESEIDDIIFEEELEERWGKLPLIVFFLLIFTSIMLVVLFSWLEI